MESYTYSNISDFINATTIVLSELQDDILGSSITSANVQYSIESGDSITIYFDGVLSGGDQTTLMNIVNAYTTGQEEEILTTTGEFNLSNKNFFTDTNFYVDTFDATKRLGFLTSGAATNTTLTLASICTTNRTITIPDITDTMATLTAVQTLTNKTLGAVIFNDTGDTTVSTSMAYFAPSTTAVSGVNNYYFTTFSAPATTGSTTGSAYTVYIAGSPTGTISNPYSFYVAGGATYLGGSIQIPTGAVNGYVLTSDASGIATWGAPSSSLFSDGTVGSPSITFTNQTNTGFYRPTTSQIGVAINGVNTALFTAANLSLATGQTLNVGTSGTTSPLNAYGLITGSNGLTITGANTSLTTLSTSGLITANAGITVATGQTLNVGTSGTTSTSIFRGLTTHEARVSISGLGNSSVASSTLYINPSATTITGSNNYYFSSFASPITTGTTTGEAYTVHIAGAPTGTITNPYALYVASGKTYMGGIWRYTNGAANSRILQCNADGDATWVDASVLSSSPITYDYIVTTTTQDTTSTTAVDIPLMTSTPTAGTYYITFSAVARTLTNNRTVNVQLAKNGTLITDALATYRISTSNIDQRVGVDTVVSCNGTDVITAQFFISGGTGTIRLTDHKSLLLIRVSA